MTEPQSALSKAARDALGGGLPGAAAMAVQVTTLMWLRTTVNYQYRYGTNMRTAMRTLYAQGGIPRFYAGYTAAIIQAPLSRFGDTAANAGMMAFFDARPETAGIPLPIKTAAASMCAASMRIALMPVDTIKTMLQVEGSAHGIHALRTKLAANGLGVLFHGSLGAAAATLAGHYPWFLTYNFLGSRIPEPTPSSPNVRALHLARAAGIGFCASLISDTVSNSLRIIKTTRQTAKTPITYRQAAAHVIEADGWRGLFGRGLRTKILSNGVQGLMFSVLWRLGQDAYNRK